MYCEDYHGAKENGADYKTLRLDKSFENTVPLRSPSNRYHQIEGINIIHLTVDYFILLAN